MKSVVLWGSGKTARRFLSTNPYFIPEYIIDNDKSKEGKTLCGYRIKFPYSADTIKNKTVVVASVYYEEIAAQLSSSGLVECVDFVSWEKIQNKNIRVRDSDFDFALKKSMDTISSKTAEYSGRPMLLTGWTSKVSVSANVPLFFKEYSKCFEEDKLLLLQEATAYSTEYYKGFHDFPTIYLPFFLDRGYFPSKEKYSIFNNEIKKDSEFLYSDVKLRKISSYVNKNKILYQAADNLREMHPEMAEGYEFFVARYAMDYFEQLFSLLKPNCVYIWNEFSATHRIAKWVADEKGIQVKYAEYGNLPGTFQIDDDGQMGESIVSVKSGEFISKKISVEEIEEARNIRDSLYLSKENRHKQEKMDLQKVFSGKIFKDRSTVLFAGQNDCCAGIYPYDDISEKFHSPIFQSSDEAAIFLAKLCKKNGWNFIYKLHPSVAKYKGHIHSYPDSMVLLKTGDINDVIDMCDVLVTILSTTNYIALIRGKPVVMLGYNQLLNKGCTYQAFQKGKIEDSIKFALTDGLTFAQEMNFIKHIAQLKKYYLFDDLKEKAISHGKVISYLEQSNNQL